MLASNHVKKAVPDGLLLFRSKSGYCATDCVQGVLDTKFRSRLKLEASRLEAIGSMEVEKVLKSVGDVSGWLRVAPSRYRA